MQLCVIYLRVTHKPMDEMRIHRCADMTPQVATTLAQDPHFTYSPHRNNSVYAQCHLPCTHTIDQVCCCKTLIGKWVKCRCVDVTL